MTEESPHRKTNPNTPPMTRSRTHNVKVYWATVILVIVVDLEVMMMMMMTDDDDDDDDD